ncbi:helix-turn-helix domain-containing protein [Streptomyces sp. GQFP]|uniref:helix-turn-helix domain-containing protein n=1 Tax=Streptomyces sp. GQFP TaxID=2907545 RepID=UPI003FA6F746
MSAAPVPRGPEPLGAGVTLAGRCCRLLRGLGVRALHIHTNTLLKRIERIGGLLGPEWQQPDNALKLQLAVHLHELARQVEKP